MLTYVTVWLIWSDFIRLSLYKKKDILSDRRICKITATSFMSSHLFLTHQPVSNFFSSTVQKYLCDRSHIWSMVEAGNCVKMHFEHRRETQQLDMTDISSAITFSHHVPLFFFRHDQQCLVEWPYELVFAGKTIVLVLAGKRTILLLKWKQVFGIAARNPDAVCCKGFLMMLCLFRQKNNTIFCKHSFKKGNITEEHRFKGIHFKCLTNLLSCLLKYRLPFHCFSGFLMNKSPQKW